RSTPSQWETSPMSRSHSRPAARCCFVGSVWAVLMAPLMCAGAFAGPTTMPIDVLRSRLIVSVLPGAVADEQRLVESAKSAADSLGADGTWADVDYTSQARSHWGVRGHLERILLLSKAYRLAHTNKP